MRRVELSEFVGVLDVLEGTGVGAWGFDIETERIVWSENIGPLFGLPEGYTPSSLDEVLGLMYPPDSESVSAAIDAAIERGEDYEVDFRVVWPDDTMRWLSARGHPISDDDGTTIRIVGVVTDATERKRESERNRFLATAGAMLGQSLDIDDTLKRLADLLVDGLADWCSVQLLSDGLMSTKPVVTHRDPDMVAFVERLQEEYPPDPQPEAVAAEVIESGNPVLLEEISDELLEQSSRDERHLELLKSLGLRSALVVPLTARGTVLGIMTLASAESRLRFTNADLDFAAEVGRRAGAAVDNAQLHQKAVRSTIEAQRLSTRLMVMQNVLASLSKAVDVASVANVATVEGAAALGASRGSVVLRSDSGLEIVASAGYTADRLEKFTGMLEQPGPLFEAIVQERPVFVEGVGNLIERYPHLEEAMAGTETGSFAAVPLVTSDGAIGSIGFVYDVDVAFTHEDRAFAAALAQHVSLAIDRSMKFDASRKLVEVLHSAIAPHPVENGNIPTAARFQAASFGAIGGDWYDMVTGPDGRRFFVLGDVVGRGVLAVGAMAALRHSLRMLLQVGYSPAKAFEELDRLASVERSALGTTAVCVEACLDSPRMKITSAGHLPPIIVSRGDARPIWVENGPPLGVGGPVETTEIVVESDEFLVLYSDGAVERPGHDVDATLEALCRSLAELAGSEDEIADVVLKRAPDIGDDVTVLVISGRRPARTDPEVD